MAFVQISDEAYAEFLDFLKENNVESFNIRVNLAGMGCGGPVFNIMVDDKNEEDLECKVKEINFIANKNLIEDFDGFKIISSEENGGRGLSLKPIKEVEGGCGSCGGGCH